MEQKRIVLGIAGLMGSGKTLAGLYFEQRGAVYIDADAVVRELYRLGHDGYRKIVQYFGDRFLNGKGEIDRQKLSSFIFSDIHKLEIIHQLIHPLVTSEIAKKLDSVPFGLVVIEAVYFEEPYLGQLVDFVLWIDASEEVLLARAMERPRMKELLAKKIIGIQKKPAKIDFTVQNNGEIDTFYASLSDVAARLNAH